MTTRAALVGTVLKLLAAAAVSILLVVLVLAAMTSPISGRTQSYSAEFSDVSGLGTSGDIRSRGVRIGKVDSIDLQRRDGGTVAEVQFEMEEPYVLTDTTVLSVKYQNLTGVRYIDADFGDGRGVEVESLPLADTRPSFDITELFNGLQPVLETMSTDDINEFTQNAITLLQGDGGGLRPMVENAQKLADLASDREQVMSTLAENLARISDSMGGRSDEVVEFMRSMTVPIASAMSVLDKFASTALYGPQFLSPITRLLDLIGLTPDTDVEAVVASAFASVEDAARALSVLPASVAGLQVPASATPDPGRSTCTNGAAALPTDVRVLLGGSEVILCNA